MNLQILSHLAARTPLAMRKFPYFIGLHLWKITYLPLRKDIQLWAKNSYALGTLVPGLSDLDGVIYSKGPQISKILNYHQKIFPWVKRFIPFLGEITFLEQIWAKNFSAIINPYELSRDPILKNKLFSDHLPQTQNAHGFVFLLRMLEADRYNLFHKFTLRKKKWAQHLQLVGIKPIFPLKNAKDLITTIYEHYASHQVFDKKVVTLAILQNYLQHGIEAIDSLSESFLFLFPHRALGLFLHHHRFREMGKILTESSREQQLLFMFHLDWELWGLAHQRYWIKDQVSLKNHLQFLQDLLKDCKLINEEEREIRERLFNQFLFWIENQGI